MVSRFAVQLHDATSLHFDLRLRSGDVLRSWAVPKAPSLDPRIRRLAVPVEDHSLSAGDFEGIHAGQARGSGAVIIWDEGAAEIVRDEPDHRSFILYGRQAGGSIRPDQDRRWPLAPDQGAGRCRPAGIRYRRRATCQRTQRQDLAGLSAARNGPP
jgi:hypothetical protein